jgi:hypothetical protein
MILPPTPKVQAQDATGIAAAAALEPLLLPEFAPAIQMSADSPLGFGRPETVSGPK